MSWLLLIHCHPKNAVPGAAKVRAAAFPVESLSAI